MQAHTSYKFKRNKRCRLSGYLNLVSQINAVETDLGTNTHAERIDHFPTLTVNY